jgi:hypothetical protein
MVQIMSIGVQAAHSQCRAAGKAGVMAELAARTTHNRIHSVPGHQNPHNSPPAGQLYPAGPVPGVFSVL